MLEGSRTFYIIPAWASIQGLLTSLIEPEETPLSTNSSRDEPLPGHSSLKSIAIPRGGHKPRAVAAEHQRLDTLDPCF